MAWPRIDRDPVDAPHAVPRRLLALRERANGDGAELDGEGIQAWLEWEWEAMRWGVPAEISGDDLEELVKARTGHGTWRPLDDGGLRCPERPDAGGGP